MGATAFQRRRRELARQQAEAAAGPEPGTREHYDTLKAADVLEAVEAGVYSPEVALAFEQERDKPRKTVLEALEPQDGEGAEDDADDAGEDASDDEE